MENGGNPSPSAASQLKGMKLGGSSRFPVPRRGLVKAKIAQGFIRSVMAPFTTTTTTVVSKDNDHETGTGGSEGEDTGAGDGTTTGDSSADSTGMNNSPNYGNGK